MVRTPTASRSRWMAGPSRTGSRPSSRTKIYDDTFSKRQAVVGDRWWVIGSYLDTYHLPPTTTTYLLPHRDFLQIPDFSKDEIVGLFDLADRMKAGKYDKKPL